MKKFPFSDHRKWNNFTFLDLLEKNNIAFSFDGSILSFPTEEAHKRARGMWYNLVGTNEIGSV